LGLTKEEVDRMPGRMVDMYLIILQKIKEMKKNTMEEIGNLF
jgi:hypothetical protein